MAIWAPFLAPARLRAVLPWLARARARGVSVVVFTKPTPEDRRNTELLLCELDEAGVRVVLVWGLHEKIVIIDRRVSYLGSLNSLSNNPATHELMVGVEGERFAQRLLENQGVKQFGAGPRRCTKHGLRIHARRSGPKWLWVCTSCPPGSHGRVSNR